MTLHETIKDGVRVIEATERLTILFANLSGRETENRADFRSEAGKILRQHTIDILEGVKGEIKQRDCPHDSHSHCMEEQCWVHEEGGYNQALSDITSLIDAELTELKK